MVKDEGFTLIETVLVLSLVTFLLSFPVLQFSRIKKETETQLFFETLQSSITLMQNHAVLNSEWTIIETFPANRSIRFKVAGKGNEMHPINHTLDLPESMALVGTGRQYTFARGSGNQSNLYKMIFDTMHGRIEVVFQMGSGRFVISQT